MFLLPHYPTTPSYLGGIFRRKKKENSKKTLYLGSPSAPRGRDIQPRGQGPEANNPTAPRSERTDPPLLRRLSDPGVGAGGRVVRPRTREVASLVRNFLYKL